MSAIESHYEPQTSVPEIKFALTAVPPPSNLYVGREDKLAITSFNSATGLSIEVHVRLMLPNGTVVPTVQAHTPNTDRTAATTTIPLAEGFILSVLIVASAGSAKRGQCYVVVGLQRGDNANPITHQVMIQGYVGTQVNQAWPGNRLEQPTEGPGWIRAFTGTQPAAGADCLETVPTGARWRMMSGRFQLVTSAAAGNRTPGVLIRNTVTTIHQAQVVANVIASTNYIIFIGSGDAVYTFVGASANNLPMPVNLFLQAGGGLSTSTGGLLAGYQWSAPQLQIEEWIEP